MSKYIDADLYVEMQIFDDEHEEWGWWKGTIEELLDQWTEQGCPTSIEVSEDCISREWVLEEFSKGRGMLYKSEYFDELIWLVIHAPSVAPIAEQYSTVGEVDLMKLRAEGEWIKRTKHTLIAQVNFAYCSECGQPIMHEHTRPLWNYCPNCGAKMRLE